LQGVTVMGAAQYFRSHWAACEPVIDLFESLGAAAAEAGSGKQQGGEPNYAPHLSAAAAEAGLDSGALLKVRQIFYYFLACLTISDCFLLSIS